MAGPTTIATSINGATKEVWFGSDASGNVTPGHTLFDGNAAPFGVMGNPVVVQDAAGEASLAAIAGSAGTTADGAYGGSGSGSVIALLKGLYARLAGTLTATISGALPAGGNTIGTVGVTGTVTVQDTAGEASLATIATQATATASAGGTTADAAYGGSGNGSLVAVLKGVYAKLSGTLAVKPWAITPVAGTAYQIVTGGTAVTMVTGPVNGCQIVNPPTPADQGLAASENAYVNPVTAAGIVGNGTTFTLLPGESWTAPGALPAGVNVSVNAATAGHKLSVITW